MENIITYPKMETIYKRTSNGLLESVYRNYVFGYLKDCNWIATEKIDGTNIRVIWDGYKVSFRGRTDKAQIPSKLLEKLEEMFGGFEMEEIFEQTFGEKTAILFGEGYGPGIQNGGNYRKDVSFILFDIYLPEQNLWLRRDNLEDISNTFGVPLVPIVFEGTLNQIVNFVKTQPDSLFGTAKMEGVVCKPAVDMLDRQGNRIITKIVVRDFV